MGMQLSGVSTSENYIGRTSGSRAGSPLLRRAWWWQHRTSWSGLFEVAELRQQGAEIAPGLPISAASRRGSFSAGQLPG